MLFKFIGQYTNGRSTIMTCGTLFEGREPADVTDPDGIRRLTNHPEFEWVTKTVMPHALRGDEPITIEWVESNLEPTVSAHEGDRSMFRLDRATEQPKPRRGRPKKEVSE
jgi:hypothetical protein